MGARGRLLWRLSLRDNVLGSAGARALTPTAPEPAAVGEAGGAARSSGLSSLDLHGNAVGDEGFESIAASLLRSPLLGSLTQLGLSTCSRPTANILRATVTGWTELT